MPRRLGPTDWMWAHAIDLVSQADRMHRQFFRLSGSPRAEVVWEPPADVFENREQLAIVVALPGVAAEAVEIEAQPGSLVIRAERPMPAAVADHGVRQLEIPYGYFERRVSLPAGRFELSSRELSHGCLILRLRRLDPMP